RSDKDSVLEVVEDIREWTRDRIRRRVPDGYELKAERGKQDPVEREPEDVHLVSDVFGTRRFFADLRHEYVAGAAKSRLQGIHRGEVGRIGASGHVRVAGGVDGDTIAHLIAGDAA